ncbi:MAG: acyl transferase [Bacteroidetes bacterium]|nr:acyl transferase [Bacteroidota bacterium]MDF2450736.1 acyl transferase [Bacteroidota bacterium]
MYSLKEIHNRVFRLTNHLTDAEFNEIAMEVFRHQAVNNKVYRDYLLNLQQDPDLIKHYSEVPFLPIEFFKTKQIVCDKVEDNSVCFSSSGTTGQITSKHFVNDIFVYETSFKKGFRQFYGNVEDYCILALLPNYLEREGSSLVYMFDKLIKDSGHPQSGFYLNNLDDLVRTIKTLKDSGQKTLLLGVTYAMLDLAERDVQLSENFIVMETGGMKGKRKELLKEELHAILKEKFNVSAIHSEYGMTELLSQAYSKKNGLFECPPWMKIMIRDVNDPFSYVRPNKGGGVNVIDLANVNSCSFIETKDLGRCDEYSHFEILGRFDNSDIRGCNLMIG